jgi:hypothetical protein
MAVPWLHPPKIMAQTAKKPQICSGFLINRHNSAIFLDLVRMRALMCQTALLLSRKGL